jgi:hypothetical protein
MGPADFVRAIRDQLVSVLRGYFAHGMRAIARARGLSSPSYVETPSTSNKETADSPPRPSPDLPLGAVDPVELWDSDS